MFEFQINTQANDALRRSILRALAYFDVFAYPLTAAEILENCDMQNPDAYALRAELDFLEAQGNIRRKGIYYYLDSEYGISKRKDSMELYPHYLRQAYRYSRIISRFPFVKAVCISGSLAKGCADKNSDVDYFIITAPGRLWICRTLLTVFKKVFLLNSRKYFCINYFVDTRNMSIPDKNIFTATEIAFLLPTYNHNVYKSFLTANDWIKSYYPNRRSGTTENVKKTPFLPLKRLAELLFSGPVGNLLEKACMRLTLAYRRRKFSHLNDDEFRHRLRTTHGVSKHHPDSFQNKVLQAYEKKLASLYARLQLRSVV